MSLHQVRRRAFAGLAAVAAGLLAAAPAVAGPTEVIELGHHNRLAILHPDGPPIGSVILIPGGSTRLTLDDAGNPLNGADNFVVRTRALYVKAGYATAMLDDPADLRDAVQRLRALARPVFFVATSRGTVVAAQNAVRLGADGPDGLVLTSSIVIRGNNSFGTVLDLPIQKIHVPLLLVGNTNDLCAASPADGMDRIAARVDATLVTKIFTYSTDQRSEPCQALSPHGYLGIEDQTVGKITDWMKAHPVAP